VFDPCFIRSQELSGFRFAAAVLIAFVTTKASAESARPQTVVIELHRQAVVTDCIVRLGDIAQVHAADELQRRAYAAVDVTGSSAAIDGRRIGRRSVDLQLQLTGFDPSDYKLIGATDVELAYLPPDRPTDAVLEQLALETLSERWSIPADDLRVTLAAPVMTHLQSHLSTASTPRLEMLPQDTAAVGRITLPLRMFDGEVLLAVHPVPLDVVRRMAVLTPAVSLPSGHALDADTLRIESRFLATTPELTTIEQVQGRHLARAVAAGELLTPRHLAPAKAAIDPPLVQARDVVRVTARKGSLTVVLSQAEALQAGRAGQLVRLRNPESNRVVVGKVVAAGEVEVAF
jgi:flagella basal body P-ring formation protein FlgA